MSLRFDVRASDLPLVDCVWRCRSTDVGQLVSVSSSHWHLVVGETEGLTEVTVMYRAFQRVHGITPGERRRTRETAPLG